MNRSMKRKLVAVATIIAMLAIPALASGTLTEVGSVGFGVGSTFATGATAEP